MNPIQEAIADIESHEDGEKTLYSEVAKKQKKNKKTTTRVDQTTLSRRHQGL
jgi:hypothetical protein